MRLPLILLLSGAAAFAATVGPDSGSLVVSGGAMGPEILNRLIALAGGPDASIIVIPTANLPPQLDIVNMLRGRGAKNVTVLHTTDRKVADSEDFVRPLKKAGGVWFTGGRQWRLVDAYIDTRTVREVRAVLDRGGVVGGSAAGASILASYLVRGSRENNTVMMAPGYERGFGFLRGVAVDSHLLERKRENDMVSVVAAHPELLGIGIDTRTAVVVKGDILEVLGASKVAIYERGKPYYLLSSGDRFDLKTHSRIHASSH